MVFLVYFDYIFALILTSAMGFTSSMAPFSALPGCSLTDFVFHRLETWSIERTVHGDPVTRNPVQSHEIGGDESSPSILTVVMGNTISLHRPKGCCRPIPSHFGLRKLIMTTIASLRRQAFPPA